MNKNDLVLQKYKYKQMNQTTQFNSEIGPTKVYMLLVRQDQWQGQECAQRGAQIEGIISGGAKKGEITVYSAAKSILSP